MQVQGYYLTANHFQYDMISDLFFFLASAKYTSMETVSQSASGNIAFLRRAKEHVVV